MRKRKVLIKACSIGISFFLSLFLFLLISLAALWSGVFSQSNILNSLKDCRYFEKSYSAFLAEAKNVLSGYELSDEVLEEVFSYAEFYNNELNLIQKQLYREPEKNGLQGDNARPTAKLRQLFSEAGLPEDKMPEEIFLRVDMLYQNVMELPLLSDIRECRSRFFTITLILAAVALTAAAVSIFILCKLCHYHHKGLRFAAYAALSAVYMELLAALYIGSLKLAETVSPGAYQDFLKNYQGNSVQMFYYAAMIGLIIFILLIAIIHSMRKKLIS